MLTALQRAQLKGIADIAFKMAGGNQACALVSRITRLATFSDYINIGMDDRSVPLDVAIDIDGYNVSRGGEPWLLRAAAEAIGHFLIRAPRLDGAASELDGLLKSAKETTEAIASGWAARADGVISPDERSGLIKEIDDAVVALLEFKAALLAQQVPA